MFEKIKKFWSSNSNINGSRKSSPKLNRTKSGRSALNLSIRKSTRPSYSNDEERIRTIINNGPPSAPLSRSNVPSTPYNGIYENFQVHQNQESVGRPSVPSTGEDVTLTSLNQDVIQSTGRRYPDSNASFCGFIEKSSPSMRSTDHLIGSARDEYLRSYRDSERPSLNTNTSTNLSYRNYMPPKTRRARSFVHLSSSSKQLTTPSNVVANETSQVFDNPHNMYVERVVRRQEPSLSSSGFVSNISSPVCRERYVNVNDESPYKEIEVRHPKYSNSSELISPQRDPRTSIGSSYNPTNFSPSMRSTSNISTSIYCNPRNLQEEVFYDKSSRGELSTAVSCQRIDELEESLRDIQRKISTSTSLQTQPYAKTDTTQHALISILMDKKNEADRLKEKIKKLENRLQKQKCDFAEETERLQLETENVTQKLKLMTEKYNKVDQEYRRYREATLTTENDIQKSIDAMNEVKEGYEREISCLKQKLTSVLVIGEDKSSIMSEEKKLLEDENTLLAGKLKEKEEEITKLNEELRLHRSFKNLLEDEEYDDDNLLVLDEFKNDNDTPKSRHKKGSCLKSGSPVLSKNLLSSVYSPSDSSGFGGSQSHGFLSSPLTEKCLSSVNKNCVVGSLSNNLNEVNSNNTTTSMTIQPRIQRIIRDSNEIGKRLRMISKCFSEISTNIVDGKDPQFHKLASRFIDSSDSDDEFNNIENKMSYNSFQFEDTLRKHQEDIQKAEKFLSQVSSNILHYTTRTPGENKNMCNVQ